MLVLVGWVVLAAPIGVFALVLPPIAARGGTALAGSDRLLHCGVLSSCLAVVLLRLSGRCVVARVPDRALRSRRAAAAAHCVQFDLDHRVAPRPVESAERSWARQAHVGGSCCRSRSRFSSWRHRCRGRLARSSSGWFYGVPLHARELGRRLCRRYSSRSRRRGPTGAFIMLTPLFLAIGLPVEGLGILIAVDAIPDMFATVLNVTGDLAAAVIVGHWQGRATSGLARTVEDRPAA